MTVFRTLEPNEANRDEETSFVVDGTGESSSLSSGSSRNSPVVSVTLEICDATMIRLEDSRVENSPGGGGRSWKNSRNPLLIAPVALLADRTAKENNINSNSAPRNPLATETRDQAAQTDNIYEAVWEKRAVDTVQALSVTVQYLAHEVYVLKNYLHFFFFYK